MQLSNGDEFVFREYLDAQRNGTQWLQDRMEWRLGMSTYVTAFNANKPHKPTDCHRLPAWQPKPQGSARRDLPCTLHLPDDPQHVHTTPRMVTPTDSGCQSR